MNIRAFEKCQLVKKANFDYLFSLANEKKKNDDKSGLKKKQIVM